jgi:septal ring factor EnvC (AmiA/AmiB activator)
MSHRRATKSKAWLGACTFLLVLSSGAWAQQPAPGTQGATRTKAPRETSEDGRAKAEAAQIDEQRARINAQLQQTARLVQRSEAQLSLVESRQEQLKAQFERKQNSLNQRQEAIASLLAALQRMGSDPPPVIITRRQDALGMVRSAMLLARAHPQVKAQADQLAQDIKEINSVLANLKELAEEHKASVQRWKTAQAQLASLIESKRQASPSPTANWSAELESFAAEISEASRNLDDVAGRISKLDAEVARITGLGRYNEELKEEMKAAAESEEKGPQVAALPPAKPAIIELAPGGGRLLSGPPGRLKPAVPFHLAKAQLPLPALGRRVLSFGDTTSNGRKSQGIVIETRYNALVTSPCDGWIVYAGEFRSYGQLLIINAGGGYHVLLAGLSHIDAQLGQFVLAGEPVGNMGAPPKGKSQDNAPVLYVEFRKEGRPTDPDPWWHEGQQKVQG